MDGGPFEGNLAAKVVSDPRARAALEDLLDDQKRRVVALLESNRYLVEALRDALLEREELVDRQILEVIEEARAAREQVVDLREPAGR